MKYIRPIIAHAWEAINMSDQKGCYFTENSMHPQCHALWERAVERNQLKAINTVLLSLIELWLERLTDGRASVESIEEWADEARIAIEAATI